MSPAPVISIALIAVNVVIFFYTVAQGALQSETAILAAGALSQELVFRGDIWRLGSAMFLHGSFEHLVGNSIGLYILGMAAEHAYGRLEMAGIYFLAGLLGSCFSVAINPGPAVGASGAIFGLLGAMIIFFAKHRDNLHLRDKRVGHVLLMWAGYSIVTAFFMPFIDNAAHVGGLIAGAFAGFAITPRMIKEGR